MKFLLSSLALVGIVSASYSNNYQCKSVDKRVTNSWCQTNCLALDGAFYSHPACFIDYRDRTIHTVCECEEYQYHAHRETENKVKEEEYSKEKMMMDKVNEYEKKEKPKDEKYYPEVEEYSYDCVSVDPRSTDKWCKFNCLALDGSFNKHPACYVPSYSKKTVHNVCKCSKGSYPQEPEVWPKEPEVWPGEPEVYPEEPEVYLEEPEVWPEEPEVYPKELEVYPEEPEVYPKEPKAWPEEPKVWPEVWPEEPEIYPEEEPEVYPEEPKEMNQYKCVSVDPRSTDKWCKVNCLALDGSFNKHPACYMSSYSKKIHNVCKCTKGEYEPEMKDKYPVEKKPKMPKKSPEMPPKMMKKNKTYMAYKCNSIDERATDKWCRTNCLSLDGLFNGHPACFKTYNKKTVHTVCKCAAHKKSPEPKPSSYTCKSWAKEYSIQDACVKFRGEKYYGKSNVTFKKCYSGKDCELKCCDPVRHQYYR
eukprot:Awhi_evm1s10287